MIRQHELMLLMTITCLLIYYLMEFDQFRIIPLNRQPYTATPSITYDKLIENGKRFRKWTNFEIDIFYDYLLKPITGFVDQSRMFYFKNNLTSDSHLCIDPRTTRGCKLDIPTRIIRWLTILKGETMDRIEQLFDQDRTTAWRDFIHICYACMYCFSNDYLKPIDPQSNEFEYLKGAGCLSNFTDAVGIIDILKLKIRGPSRLGYENKRNHFDGHHHEYNVGIGLICDGYGLSRNISGPNEGSCNDINIYQNSDWYENEEEHFGDGKLVADGIFRYTNGSFICSFPNPTTQRQLLFNVLHILARTMVEHVIGRQRSYWPIISNVYTYHLQWIGIIYRNVAILTNILVIFQSPMRKR